jgi:carboxyl-terminal processing protease
MRRNKQFLWLAVGATALMGFSFAAGYGLRAIMWAIRGGAPALAGSMTAGADTTFDGYPRLASRSGAETTVGHAQVFSEVMSRLRDLYVEPLPPSGALSVGVVEGMLNSLGDANTRLLMPKEWNAVNDAQTGAFRGLGAVLTIRRYRQESEATGTPRTQLTVVAPMPGSPAEKAGLLPGDRITAIDEHWIAPMHLTKRMLAMLTEDVDYQISAQYMKLAAPLPEEERQKPPSEADRKAIDEERQRLRNATDVQSAIDTLTGDSQGEHTLTVERTGSEKPLTIKVQLARTTVAPVAKKKVAPTVAYLHVRQMNPEAVRAVDQALAEFRVSGLKSLVLDLRHSPGGSLAQAQEIASRFLTSGAVAIEEKRDSARKKVKKPLAVRPVDRRTKFTAIAVLVDGGTAGSSEILAAALRDAGLAKLVGETTFGDGTEQLIVPLQNGAAISLTTAKMFTRNGVDFDGKGLKPDEVVAPAAGADRALEQALRLVRPS